MRVLLIDNYDSYTFNLFQLIADVYSEAPLVVRNDAVRLEDVEALLAEGVVQHIVISPGPGTPSEPGDVGVCLDVLRALSHVPVLGVCLGHQALAAAHGGRVVRAPEPVHGRLSSLRHNGHRLFEGCPSGPDAGMDVVRYHSLVVDADTLPPCLHAIAWACHGHHAVELAGDKAVAAAAASATAAPPPAPTPSVALPPAKSGAAAGAAAPPRHASAAAAAARPRRQPPCSCTDALGWVPRSPPDPQPGPIMALAHATRPHWGVQFHPESVATRYGMQLLSNFQRMACAAQGVAPPPRRAHPPTLPRAPSLPPWPWPWPWPDAGSDDRAQGAATPSGQPEAAALGPGRPGARPQLLWRRLPGLLAAVGGSQALFESLVGPGDDSWWLDSAATDRGRFSFFGGKGGALWRRITYWLPQPPALAAAAAAAAGAAPAPTCQPQRAAAPAASGAAAPPPPPPPPPTPTPVGRVTVTDAAGRTRHADVSLFAYLREQLALLDLRFGEEAATQLPHNFWGGFVGYLGYELKAECGGGAAAHASPTPDAALFFADRVVCVDHATGDVHCTALFCGEEGGGRGDGGGSRSSLACSAHGGDRARGEAAAWLDHTCGLIQRLASPAHAGGSAASTRSAANGVARGTANGAAPGAAVADGAHASAGGEGPTAAARVPPSAYPCGACSSCRAAAAAPAAPPPPPPPPPWRLRHGRARYLAAVGRCQAALQAGESYEVCLTTALTRPAPPCPAFPWAFYTALRRVNPAPYAAWMRTSPAPPPPGRGGAAAPLPPRTLSVCCSSPERFLRGARGGVLEARPIKGTARRAPGDAAADAALAAALAGSEKERAENLMIVDLLRNDLGRVCAVGSVHVPGLIQLESYATVHQLVSTVRGLRRRRGDGDGGAGAGAAGLVSNVDCVAAAFPGGSMTGAPKVRSMALLDALEGAARGVYSGSIGYFSVNDTFDLNIVIRTAVFDCPRDDGGAGAGAGAGDSGSVHVGAGGAIVVQSEAEEEWEEMRLKARALLQAMALAEGWAGEPAVEGDGEGEG